MIDHILATPELRDRPPVLVDIGASGNIHAKWKRLAKHAICIAFDPDKREMQVLDGGADKFRKLFVINKIVADKAETGKRFFLTDSPYCSSTLAPEQEALQVWSFAHLFKVVGEERFDAITVGQALQETGLPYIDWLKIDSQGTDLRIFLSIADHIRKKLLAVEMEPGFIDVYQGEDKLHQVVKRVTEEGFWLSDVNVLGVQRMNMQEAGRHFSGLERKLIARFLPISPCWAELTFLNALKDISLFEKRDLLLIYLFALLEKQYGFCLEIAGKAMAVYKDNIFQQLHDHAVKKIRRRIYGRAIMNAPVLAYKKLAQLF